MVEPDVMVVGAGIVGLATARALAGANAKTTLLEQFTVGHSRGSSHGNARIFKLSYPDEEWVRLAQVSLLQWRELERASGEQILTCPGSLDIGELPGRREALDACGVEYEFLDSAEIARRYDLKVEDDTRALFQADGGVLHADKARDALLRGARSGGVDVVENTTVRELAVDDDSVLLQTTAGELRARAVVVTAGPWVDRIVGAIGLVLDVTPVRETVAYFRPRVADDVPTLSEWRLEERLVNYGLLNRDGLLKVGVSGSGVPCDPDGPAEIDQSVVAQASEWAARHFALAGDAPVAAETCTYTNTPDERFIVERHGRVVIGSACSGHGFKFAPVVGEQLAALAREAAAS